MPPKKGTVLRGFQVDLESDVPVPEQIMASLQKNQVRVMDLFREWDEDGNGLITKKEFCHAMPRLGIVAPSREFELLFDTFDPDGSGAIDMKELQKGLRRKPAQDPAKETKNAAASQKKNAKTLQEQMLADLKKILQKKMLVLQKLFKEWDEDGNTAWLPNRRLWQCPSSAPAPPQGAPGGSLWVVRPSKRRDQATNSANHCLECSISPAPKSPISVLSSHPGSGSVNRKEWHKAMPAIGIQTTREMLDVLFDAFDEDGSGEIEFAELQARLVHAAMHCTSYTLHTLLLHCAVTRRRRCASRACSARLLLCCPWHPSSTHPRPARPAPPASPPPCCWAVRLRVGRRKTLQPSSRHSAPWRRRRRAAAAAAAAATAAEVEAKARRRRSGLPWPGAAAL